MNRRHLLMATRNDNVQERRRLRIVRAAEFTAYERRQQRRQFAAAVAGVCLAAVAVGLGVGIVVAVFR